MIVGGLWGGCEDKTILERVQSPNLTLHSLLGNHADSVESIWLSYIELLMFHWSM